MKTLHVSKSGFTVVELMVGITVLVILAVIVTFVYSDWDKRSQTTFVKSDLQTAATAMEEVRNFNNGYPLSLPANFEASQHVTVTYHSGDAKNYCINGQSKRLSAVRFHIEEDNSEPQAGTC